MGPLHLTTTWYKKIPWRTSDALRRPKQQQQQQQQQQQNQIKFLDEVTLFWMSLCVACSPARCFFISCGSYNCKGPIVGAQGLRVYRLHKGTTATIAVNYLYFIVVISVQERLPCAVKSLTYFQWAGAECTKNLKMKQNNII